MLLHLYKKYQIFIFFVISHGRTTLDLTLAIRFSNLPNNAKLELTKSTIPRSQAQGEVTIALQLENGERLHHTFQPSTSLWQILEHWESQNEWVQVCVCVCVCVCVFVLFLHIFSPNDIILTLIMMRYYFLAVWILSHNQIYIRLAV